MASTSASTSVCDVSAEIDSEESSFDNDEQETTEERDTTTTSEASSSTVVSLLERLRVPKKSELTRKRKIFANPSREPGMRKKRPCCSSNPKSVTPAQRVREFPNECFTVSSRTLFCDACRQEGIKGELPTYLALAQDVTPNYDTLNWWKGHAHELPYWSTAVHNVLVQPSSASSEHVFSLLKASFGPQQDCSLQDYIESSLMLQFNKR